MNLNTRWSIQGNIVYWAVMRPAVASLFPVYLLICWQCRDDDGSRTAWPGCHINNYIYKNRKYQVVISELPPHPITSILCARNRSHNDKWHIWKCKSKFNNRFALYSVPFTYFVTEGRTNIYRYVYLIELIYQEKYFSKNCFAMIDVNSVMLCYQLLTRRLTHFSLSHSDVLLLSPLLFTQTCLSDTSVWCDDAESQGCTCVPSCADHTLVCAWTLITTRGHSCFEAVWKAAASEGDNTHTQTHAPLIHWLGTPAPLTPPVHHQMASVLTRDFS